MLCISCGEWNGIELNGVVATVQLIACTAALIEDGRTLQA